jgi:hypothetical protein
MRRHRSHLCLSSICTVASKPIMLGACLGRPCRRTTVTTVKATLRILLISMCHRRLVPCQSHQSRTTSRCLSSSLSTTIARVHPTSILPCPCNMLDSVHLFRQCLSSINSSSIYINIGSSRCTVHNAQYTHRIRIRGSRSTVVALHPTQTSDQPLTTFSTMLHVSRGSCRSALTLQ